MSDIQYYYLKYLLLKVIFSLVTIKSHIYLYYIQNVISSLVTRTLPFAVPKWFVGEAGLVMLSSQLAKRCGEDGGGD